MKKAFLKTVLLSLLLCVMQVAKVSAFEYGGSYQGVGSSTNNGVGSGGSDNGNHQGGGNNGNGGGNGGGAAETPLDGGMCILLAAGVALVAIKVVKNKKKKLAL